MEMWNGWFDAWGDEKHHTTSADAYAGVVRDMLKKGSLNITDSSDLFLYHTVDRTAKPKDDDNSSGGSSTHTSSSGTTHGGGSGKF